MPLVSSPIPNLVGGISQQPAAMRLPNMCNDMRNAWPSVVSGLQKRPPTRHVAELGNLGSSITGHLIVRDEDYRYSVIVANGTIKVVDLNTGTVHPVSTPDGTAYLNTFGHLPVDTFRFVTLGDYTFITNRHKVVTASPVAEVLDTTPVPGQRRFDPTNMATFWVTQAAYNTWYSVYINGVLKAQYLTPDGVTANPTGTTPGRGMGGASGQITPVPDTGTIAITLAQQLNAAGYTTLVDGSAVTITNFNPSWTLQTQGGSGDKMCRGYVYDVPSFSDLMPIMFDGRLFRIAADLESANDDYYVVYHKGVWIETLDWNAGEKLNNDTMPHVLVRNADGTWTFKRHTWKGRQVGDSHSSKTPSFVGFTINDLFTFTNRLGFLADENIIMSEVANYENFYRTTAAQLLESDPIDIAVLHNNVDILYHAVPYNRDLLLMSEKSQFRLNYQNYLGPKTVRVDFTTAFNVSRRNRPLNLGNSVYFVDDRADYVYAKVFEFHPQDNATTDDADEVTGAIPEVIKYDVDFIAASNRARTLVVHSRNATNTLYVYKYFWNENRKAQSAWSVWTFDDCTTIHWACFDGDYLYGLFERNGSIFLERIRADEDVWDTDANFEIMLDRRVTIAPGSMSYNAVTEKTTITLPYDFGVAPEVVAKDLSLDATSVTGMRPAVDDPFTDMPPIGGYTTIHVEGDLTDMDVTVGIPYTMYYEFSTIYMKQKQGNGVYQVVQDGRLQLRYLTLEYHDTTAFDVTVTLQGRDPLTKKFSGQVIGSDNLLGRQPVDTGKFRVPVMSDALKAKIVITNDTPFPCAFGSAEWQGIYHPKSATRVQ